jgi:hypothetical protein
MITKVSKSTSEALDQVSSFVIEDQEYMKENFPQCKTKEEIHECDTNSAKKERPLSADAIGEWSIQNNGKPIDERHDRLKNAQLRVLPSKKVCKDGGHCGVVVPCHVEKRVEESERQPVDNAQSSKFCTKNGAFRWGVCHCRPIVDRSSGMSQRRSSLALFRTFSMVKPNSLYSSS